MKKITLLLAAFAMTAVTNAQIVLSHSTDNTTSVGGSVACRFNPDMTPNTGDEGSGANKFSRAYTPADFGVTTGTFQVLGADFFIEFRQVGPDAVDVVDYTLRFSTSDGVFPAGTLTEVASQVFEANIADAGNLVMARLDTPVAVSSAAELIVTVDFLGSPALPNNYDITIGYNELGQDAPSFIGGAGTCIAGATDLAALNSGAFATHAYVLDVVGDEIILGVNDSKLALVSVYPNPTKDVLNLKVPSTVEVTNVNLFDVLGKKVSVSYNEGLINTSSLSQGIYLLKVETNVGTLTQKVVKQ